MFSFSLIRGMRMCDGQITEKNVKSPKKLTLQGFLLPNKGMSTIPKTKKPQS